VTGHAGQRRLRWTALGQQLGYTGTPLQRQLILDAIARMAWTADPDAVPHLHGEAVRTIVNTVFGRRRPAVRQVGVAQLNGRHLLIGLEHHDRERVYLLDLDSVAILVLANTRQPAAPARHHRVA
jgi:hypothetical protein